MGQALLVDMRSLFTGLTIHDTTNKLSVGIVSSTSQNNEAVFSPTPAAVGFSDSDLTDAGADHDRSPVSKLHIGKHSFFAVVVCYYTYAKEG